MEAKCPRCNNVVPGYVDRCPHCGEALAPPNVRAAKDAEEQEALESRYREQQMSAGVRRCERVLAKLEDALSRSEAVIARSITETRRLATSDKELYATYYQLAAAEVRLPGGSKWDVLRRVADDALFPGYKEKMRFASLTLNGCGISSYGDCFLVLRTNMIADRATVFEENSVMFMLHHDIRMADAGDLPKGYRAAWGDRVKLCVAKLGSQLRPDTCSRAFAGMLSRKGASSADDQFVEVHIWGSLSHHSLRLVKIQRAPDGRKRISRAIINELRERLEAAGVEVEII